MANSKRSRQVALMLMAPAGSFLLHGCSEAPQEGMVFESQEQCQRLTGNAAECLDSYNEALQAHQQSAPRYSSEQACETDFGANRCETTPGGWVTPLMAGFLMAKMLDVDFKKKKKPFPGKPLYKSRDDFNTFRSAANVPVAKSTGPIQVNKSVLTPPGKSVTRGGFGMQAQKRAQSAGGGSYGG
ncbi:MAG: DUF1190 domain-containing protein [Plesiomonas shigelloides]